MEGIREKLLEIENGDQRRKNIFVGQLINLYFNQIEEEPESFKDTVKKALQCHIDFEEMVEEAIQKEQDKLQKGKHKVVNGNKQ